MELLEFRPYVKNTLRGFATVSLSNGLVIHDMPVHNSAGRHWAGMPSKPMLAPDGTAKREGGKIKYVRVLEWSDKDTGDRFSDALCELVSQQHPGSLD